jgi:mRNA interferase RelE/StbE
MVYTILYRPIVTEEHIPALSTTDKAHIKHAIETKLTHEPRIFGKPLRYSQKGLWTLRVGDYRAIYLCTASIITIVAIGPRRDIYEK